jgi:hypothetical protein
VKTEPRKTVIFLPATPDLERRQRELYKRMIEATDAAVLANPETDGDLDMPGDESKERGLVMSYEVIKVDDERGVVRRSDGKLILRSPAKLRLCQVMADALNQYARKKDDTRAGARVSHYTK